MKQPPFFSVLIPVYNVEKWLPQCIDSVLRQTYSDWELVLVDDGSTDNSGTICEEYAAKYPEKINVFHKKNQGLFHTRRYAFGKANGQYCVCVDSDDALETNALAVLARKFQQYTCDCIVYGFYVVQAGNVLAAVREEKETVFHQKRDFYRKILLNHTYNSLCRKAFKRTLLSKITSCEPWHIGLGEDLVQSLALLHNCQSVVFIEDVLYRYNQNPLSITKTPSLDFVDHFLELGQYVWVWVAAENVLTSQDIQDFHDYYVSLFEEKIRYICSYPIPRRQKIDRFVRLAQAPYYTDFLAASCYRQPATIVYFLFRRGQYGMLIWLAQVYKRLKKLVGR